MKQIYIIAGLAVIIAALLGFQFGRRGAVIPGFHMMDDGVMMHDSDMSGMMQMMGAMLEGREGIVLDRAFLAAMIPHHQGAVAMCQPVLRDGLHNELKSLCRDIIEAQTREIEMMREWQKQW